MAAPGCAENVLFLVDGALDENGNVSKDSLGEDRQNLETRDKSHVIRPSPQEASGEYLYGSTDSGCCGIRVLAEDSDIAVVDSAFKLLTSPETRVATEARSHVTSTTERRIGRTPSTDEVGIYLSGEEEGPFSTTRGIGIRGMWFR